MEAQIGKRVYHLAWYFSEKFPRINHLRDTASFTLLMSILNQHGFVYGDTILNLPSKSTMDSSKFVFSPQDLVVLTTRPPISDLDMEDRRRIYRSGGDLETHILFTLKSKIFRVASRSHIKLTETLASRLPVEYLNRSDIQFFCNRSKANPQQLSSYRFLKKYPWDLPPETIEDSLSCFYFVFLKSKFPYPACLALFSVGGFEGLRSCLFLKEKFEDLNLNFDGDSRFIMVEFPSETINSERLSDYSIKNYTIVADRYLDE